MLHLRRCAQRHLLILLLFFSCLLPVALVRRELQSTARAATTFVVINASVTDTKVGLKLMTPLLGAEATLHCENSEVFPDGSVAVAVKTSAEASATVRRQRCSLYRYSRVHHDVSVSSFCAYAIEATRRSAIANVKIRSCFIVRIATQTKFPAQRLGRRTLYGVLYLVPSAELRKLTLRSFLKPLVNC